MQEVPSPFFFFFLQFMLYRLPSTYNQSLLTYYTCYAEWMTILHVTSVGLLFYLQHCGGINCLAVLKSSGPGGSDYLFTGSRDGTLKRWVLGEDVSTCSATFESHVDWVSIILLFV